MRILVTGARGRLGSQLLQVLPRHGHEVIAATSDDFDVTDFSACQTFVASAQPELVVHSAAWTDVEGCARDPRRALQVNGFGAQHMALAAAGVGAGLFYISSNEVFDGQRSTPYNEYDRANPINPYGYSKWVGERAVQTVNPRHYIARTAWLFAHGGKNFIQSILNAAQAGKQLRVVTDEVANPTYTNDLATAIAALLESGRYGIYHLVNAGACSRYEFARYILERAGYAALPIERIASHEWLRASRPPMYSGLDNLAGQQIGVVLRPWQAAVDTFLNAEGLLGREV